MKQVTWIGEPGLESYHGFDGDKGVNIEAGKTVTVSDEKAEQLAADFGHLCSIEGHKPAAKPDSVAPVEDDVVDEDTVEDDDETVEDEAGDVAEVETAAAEPAAAAPKRRSRK